MTAASRSRIDRRLLIALLLVANLGLAFAASARGSARADDEEGALWGFSPYFDSGPYAFLQRVEGEVDTDFGPTEKAQNLLTNMGWSFQLGLRSPRLADVPGKPRLDLQGGVLLPTNPSGTISSKVDVSSELAATLKEEVKLAVDYNTSYHASLGVEVVVDGLPVEIRITPAVRYLSLTTRLDGLVDSTRSFQGGAQAEIVRNAAVQKNLRQHLLGPSLRVATEPIELWGIEGDLYLEGDLLVDLEGMDESLDAFTEDARRASFRWEADRVAGLVRFGFRLLLP
jgi:hypothetical protein